MKRWSLLIFLFFVSGCLGQNSGPQSSDIEQSMPVRISQSALAQLIQEGGDFLLIDVRTKGEYQKGHLPGAIVIPYNEFETRYNELLEYKDQEIVLYCHVGGMGGYAGSILLKHGFTKVKNLDGGIYGWINSGGEIVS